MGVSEVMTVMAGPPPVLLGQHQETPRRRCPSEAEQPVGHTDVAFVSSSRSETRSYDHYSGTERWLLLNISALSCDFNHILNFCLWSQHRQRHTVETVLGFQLLKEFMKRVWVAFLHIFWFLLQGAS